MGQDRKVRIALGQMKVVQGDTKENLRKMMEMIDQAAEQNVDIICFPELAYTGYFLESEELQKLAEPVDGPFVQTMRKCAKSKGCTSLQATQNRYIFREKCIIPVFSSMITAA